jgi:6-phospho-beta-glucosidase
MQTEGAWNEGGKGMSVFDIRKPVNTPRLESGDRLLPSLPEDFDLMQDLGMTAIAFRSRSPSVFPQADGEFNERG